MIFFYAPSDLSWRGQTRLSAVPPSTSASAVAARAISAKVCLRFAGARDKVTLFVKTTDDCPSNEEGPGGCYPGSKFLQNQIASDPGLAQEANWDDVTALVGTMANQIVAGIC